MAALSRDQIAMYAQAAGLSPAAAKTATSIALAESGGDPRAHNATPPDDSYGLWQINMLGGMGPSRRKSLGITSNEQLYDPAVNARAMAMISSKGKNFTPWTTYTSGAAQRVAAQQADWKDWFLPPALGLLPDGTVPGVGGSGSTVLGGLEGITSMAELAVGAGKWLSDAHNWVRVAQVVVGGGLVYVGLVLAFRQQLQPLAKQAASAIPQAKVLAAANAVKSSIKSGGSEGVDASSKPAAKKAGPKKAGPKKAAAKKPEGATA